MRRVAASCAPAPALLGSARRKFTQELASLCQRFRNFRGRRSNVSRYLPSYVTCGPMVERSISEQTFRVLIAVRTDQELSEAQGRLWVGTV